MQRLVAALRPSGNEILQLARAEMDPACYARFEPLTAGPVCALAGLVAVAMLGILAAPMRLLRRVRPG